MPTVLTRFKTLAIATLLALSVALPLAGVAHADERDFTLVNNSSAVLTHLYVSPTSADDWGDDILGRDVMAPGDSVLVYFTKFSPDGCGYDLRVTFQDGSTGTLLGVDLCATDTVTVSDT